MTLQILTKCALITIFACLVSLCFFDLQNMQIKLQLSYPSCLSLEPTQSQSQFYVCSVCYNFQAKNQNLFDQYLRFESSQPFAVFGVKQHQAELLQCNQYIQLMKYTSQAEKQLLLGQLESASFEMENFISTNQNWKNKGLFIKSQKAKQLYEMYLVKEYKQFVIYYYAQDNQKSRVNVFQDNIQNYNNFRRITKLLALGTLIGILFHILFSNQKIKLIYKSIFQIINLIFILVIFCKEDETLIYHEIFKFQIIFWAICLNIFGVYKKLTLLFLLILLIPNTEDIQTLFRMIAYPIAIYFYMANYQHKQINGKKNLVVILLSIQLIVFSFHNFFIQGSFQFGFNMIRVVLIIMGHLMTIKKLDYFQLQQRNPRVKIISVNEDQQCFKLKKVQTEQQAQPYKSDSQDSQSQQYEDQIETDGNIKNKSQL